MLLSDTNINMCTRRKLLEACVRSRLVYGTQACLPNAKEMRKLESCWIQTLRYMVKGGWAKKPPTLGVEGENYRLLYNKEEIVNITHTMPLQRSIEKQYLKYIAHTARHPNTSLTKKLLFAKASKRNYRDPWIKISKLLGVSLEQSKATTQSRN